jgi:hypothetical protein
MKVHRVCLQQGISYDCHGTLKANTKSDTNITNLIKGFIGTKSKNLLIFLSSIHF